MRLIKRRITFLAAGIMTFMMLLPILSVIKMLPVYAETRVEEAISFTDDEDVLSQVNGADVAVQLYYTGTVAGALNGELDFDADSASFLEAVGADTGSGKGAWSVNEQDGCVRYAWVDTIGAFQDVPVMTFYFSLNEDAEETTFTLRADKAEAYGTSGQGDVSVIQIPAIISAETLTYVRPVDAVQIVTQPVDYIGEAGERATLHVEATGTELAYQWQYMKSDSNKWVNSGLSTAKSPNLSFKMSAAYDGMKFRCVITDAADNETISKEVRVTLFTGPKITTQPVSCEQSKGKPVSFTVVATGEELSYQWQYLRPGGTNWTNSGLASARNSILAFTMSAGYDGMHFRCVVTDKNGQSATSDEVTVSIKTGPVIVTQPVSVEQAVGTPVALSVAASGNSLTYLWQYQRAGTTTWKTSTASGFNTDTVSFKMAAAHEGMKFRCIITDAEENTAITESAQLFVLPGPGIINHPVTIESALGVPVKMSVSAVGTGLTYQWQYQRPGKTTWTKSGLSSATSTTLKFTMASGYDGMKFRCVVTDDAGYSAISNEASVTALEGPGIITQPIDINASAGTVVKISTQAVGQDVAYCWQYQRVDSTTWGNSHLSSASLSTLSFRMSSAYDGMKFRCKITDADGKTAYTDAVVIMMVEGPAIAKQPEDVTTAIGTKATFSINASGNSLTYQWQFQKIGKTTWVNSTSAGNNTDTLKVSATNGTNGLKFRCVVTDAEGNVSVSDYAVLTAK